MGFNEKSFSAELDSIGKRIRDIRRKKGMTQSELAGYDITRNMLSRIENGAALPSLPTLLALADRLDIPAGALIGDFDDYAGRDTTEKFESLLKAKKYLKIIEISSSEEYRALSVKPTEIVCKAHIEYAFSLYQQGKLTLASEHLLLAEALNDDKFRDYRSDADRIFVLKELIDICPAGKSEEAHNDLPGYTQRLASIIFRNEDAVYLYCLSKLSGITGVAYSMPHERAGELRRELSVITSPLTSKLYSVHIDAKLHMISAEYLDAKAKLLTLLPLEPPAAILYDIYADLEFCCKCCGDFENAYKYSGKRLELIQHIK